MKKKIFKVFFATALIVCVSMFTLAACTTDPNEHTHTLTKVAAVAADCTKEGNTEYYTCDCGKYFSDSKGETEIKSGSWKIAALGHDYTEVLKDDGKYYNVCSRGDSEVFLADAGTSQKYPVVAADKETLMETVKQGGFVKLTADMTVTGVDFQKAISENAEHKAVNIDLGGKKLSLTAVDGNYWSVTIANGQALTIVNGTMDLSNTKFGTANADFAVYAGSSITLDDVKVTMIGGFLCQGKDAALSISNSELTSTGYYAISTNASTEENYGVKINLENSKINMTLDEGDSCAVMLNVAGTLDIKNCKIDAQRQGVFVRAGTATIVDTDITANIKNLGGDSDIKQTSHTAAWGSGNNVAFGAIVVGNDTTSTYSADAVLKISGGNVVCATADENLKNYTNALYGLRLNNDKYKTEITVDGTVFDGLIVNYQNTATISGLKEGTKVLTTWKDGQFVETAVAE